MELEIIFNKVRQNSYKLNKKYKNFDGLAYWKPIKKILSDINGNASKWIKQNTKFTNYVMNKVPEFVISNNKQELIEHNHFIIQTIRIPLQEKPSIRKIIQLL